MDNIKHDSWALYENFDVFTAAALWCGLNPYDCANWENIEYIEVRNLIIHILRHQFDAEGYPVDKRNRVIMILAEKFDKGIVECLTESKKFILSRSQLKTIAIKNGVKPDFLFGNRADTNIISNKSHNVPDVNNGVAQKITDNSLDSSLKDERLKVDEQQRQQNFASLNVTEQEKNQVISKNKRTMADVIAEDSVKFIKLPFFLTSLQFSPQNKGFDATNEVFFRLLDKGLKLHFSEPGYVNDGVKISNGDVKCALRKIDDSVFEADTQRERDKLFSQEIIKTESGYEIPLFDILIGQDNVKQLYVDMGLDSYPWVKVPWPYAASDCIDYPIDKLKRKQQTQKEPHSLNSRYVNKPGKDFQQRNWDAIPEVRQSYWTNRDTFTILELAFLLKGKEPQPQATQQNVINLYPLEFCEFFADLLTLADSSNKVGTLVEVNPPAPNYEEYEDTPDFERKKLIEWAISKEIDVPEWLSTKSTNKAVEQANKNISSTFDDTNNKVKQSKPEVSLLKEQQNSTLLSAIEQDKQTRCRGKTRINEYLYQLWLNSRMPNAEGLVRALRPLVGQSNCPVKKYHGWYDEICVEWHPNCGSVQLSWGKKSFQNKVTDFKKEHQKTLSSEI